MTVFGMSVDHRTGLLTKTQFEYGPLDEREVFIEVSHCGVCRGDLRLFERKNEGEVQLPGHEVIGKIVGTGRSVSGLALGTRVGVGWQSASCRRCSWCEQDTPELCPTQEETCMGRPGGYASHIKVQADFVVPIPERLRSIDAAPLLCGGLAAFNPLLQYELGIGQRVGVVGLGGVGHMAVQFLKALGSEPVVFSSSNRKQADAFKLGAVDFVNLAEGSAMKGAKGSCDFVFCTSSGAPDWHQLMGVLRPGGTLCIVGVTTSELRLPVTDLIDERKTIAGNPIGSPSTLKKLLAFAAEHELRPWTETFPMSRANEAINKLRQGDLRFRAILEQDLVQ